MYKTNITSRSYLGAVQKANDKFRSLNFVDPSKTEPPSHSATSNLIKFFNPLLTQWIAESESDEWRPTKISWLHLSSHICRFLFTIKRCELLWIHVALLSFTLQQDNIKPDCEFWSFPALSPHAIGKVPLIDAFVVRSRSSQRDIFINLGYLSLHLWRVGSACSWVLLYF